MLRKKWSKNSEVYKNNYIIRTHIQPTFEYKIKQNKITFCFPNKRTN